MMSMLSELKYLIKSFKVVVKEIFHKTIEPSFNPNLSYNLANFANNEATIIFISMNCVCLYNLRKINNIDYQRAECDYPY